MKRSFKPSKLALVIAISFSTLPGTALLAQESDSNAAQNNEDAEQIVIIGSRVKGRTQIESNVPVDVIGGEKLRLSGYTDTNSMLERVVPSINFRKSTGTDTLDHQRPITMRGLPPGMSLVLLNKQRHHPSAMMSIWGQAGGTNGVNLDTIPALAIKRVEVLRDGAAAQYGADAIGGVINFELQDADEGGQVRVSHGMYYTSVEGLEDLQSVNANNETGQLEFIGTGSEVEKRDGRTTTIDANYGMSLFEDGFLNLSLSLKQQDPSNRGGFDARQMFNKIEDPNTGELIFDPREETVERYRMRYGQSELDNYSFLYNAEMPINENFNFFSTGKYYNQDSLSWGYTRRPNDSRNVPEIYPLGYTPHIAVEIIDYFVNNGVRGDINGWETDLSVYYGVSDVTTFIKNTLNRSYGTDSKTTLFNGVQKQRDWYVTANTTKLVENALWQKDLNVAFGATYRNERFEIEAGEMQSWHTRYDIDDDGNPIFQTDGNGELILDDNGNPLHQYSYPGGSQVLPGFSPENAVVGKRNSFGTYVDLDMDMTDDWNLATAVRYENYSDFGSTLTGKLATRYTITDWFNVRAALSTGFMAPSLVQNYTQSTNTEIADGNLFDVSLFSTTHPVAQALGADTLEPTKSTNLSVGFASMPISGMELSLDFYRIDIEDMIRRTRFLSGHDVEQIIADAGLTTRASHFQYQANLYDQEVTGFDMVLTYDVPTENFGTFQFGAVYNYNKLDIKNIKDVPDALKGKVDDDGNPLMLFDADPERVNSVEKANPPHKFNGSMIWQYDNLSVSFIGTRYGAELQPLQIQGNERQYQAAMVYDLDLTYRFDNGLSLSFGAMNLFDQYPKKDNPECPANGCSVWDRIESFRYSTGFGFEGRYIYSKLNYSF
ncbi:TonB-dependent receptor [Bowmanella sp. Y26]|uniref:TonB-dependent receptor plug domain-containing protein n=1 Tax=Bowmanella yangjiangensis TaxID=2811230 RepID=UPI001BDCD62E|nr:TonB-dependent receptor [Bowmanella yangjiangensis]MBT1064384.1 TonB-dependent receptor [Bowmanella yangjiangensis]